MVEYLRRLLKSMIPTPVLFLKNNGVLSGRYLFQLHIALQERCGFGWQNLHMLKLKLIWLTYLVDFSRESCPFFSRSFPALLSICQKVSLCRIRFQRTIAHTVE